jgi:ABC-type branched-subunit amino acid transport system substrate-binding protein
MQRLSTLVSSFFLCLVLLFPPVVSAQQQKEKKPIYLGQSCALTGPTKNLGLELRAGLLAAFSEANQSGGIDGREVVLLSIDDGYEPYRAVQNTRKLLDKDNVFLLIGEVGTPTSEAVIALTEKEQVPFFAPYTGAEFLRTPFKKYVVNIRGSYFQEMEKVVSYFVDTLKFTRISCFYQNDSFGFTGLRGAQSALKKRNLQLVSTGTYERNTVAVLGGMKDIYKGDPQAVLMVGAYAACVEFIKLSKLHHSDTTHFSNISFVGSTSLQKALGNFGDNVIISQVVPFPWNSRIPLVRDYVMALDTYQAEYPPGFTSLEGYIAGRLFCAIARKVKGDLTRESFIRTMEDVGKFDLGGVVLEFGPNDHQGMDSILLTSIFPNFKVIE